VTSVQSCTGPPLRAAATREERGEEVGRVELIRLPSGSRRQTDTVDSGTDCCTLSGIGEDHQLLEAVWLALLAGSH
jgi:hypothetical protein